MSLFRTDDIIRAVAGSGSSISSIKEIQTLWGGYGVAVRLIIKLNNGENKSIVVKQVQPPRDASGISNQRKLKSYQVEKKFYQELAPHLIGKYNINLPSPLYISENTNNKLVTFALSDLCKHFPNAHYEFDYDQTLTVLDWLAAFHAANWEEKLPDGVWEQGSYWHLKTRPDEFRAIPERGEWAILKSTAQEIDKRLNGHWPINMGGSQPNRFRTLIHGDLKPANILFSKHDKQCACYDLQYCGYGYGAVDLVYLFVSGLSHTALIEENNLLKYYHKTLCKKIGEKQGKLYEDFPFSQLQCHFDHALLDYVRFMAGWGFWGNVDWITNKAKEIIRVWLIATEENINWVKARIDKQETVNTITTTKKKKKRKKKKR